MPDHEVLFLPGPVEVDPELRQIMSMPLISHRHPRFVAEARAVCHKLQALFQTDCQAQGSATLFDNCSATLMMEAAIRNLVGQRVLHLCCGAFGERWAEISRACGRQAHSLCADWGQAIGPEMLRAKLSNSEAYEAVTITHCETSTAVLSPLRELAAVVWEQSPETLVLVDGVSSLAGAEIRFDDWGLDLVLAGTQKCLALPPGLTVYAISARALTKAQSIQGRGYLLDFCRARQGLAEGKAGATPCVPLVFALSRQLDRIDGEGLEQRWQRHQALQASTAHWARQAGFEFFVDEPHRSPTVTALLASGQGTAKLAERARQAGFTMDQGYGKLAGKTFRIGHMGDHTTERLQRFLSALSP